MIDLTDTPLPTLAPRRANSHKGDYGRAMIVGGSRGMSGAVAMAGLACLRSGAGLVTLAVPESVQQTVAGLCPAYTTHGLVEDDRGRIHWANAYDLAVIAPDYDAWAVGPGLGGPGLGGPGMGGPGMGGPGLSQTGVGWPDQSAELVGRMYADWPGPLLVDADGLNALAAQEHTHGPLLTRPGGPRILTPHPGEFATLAGGGDAKAAASSGEDARRVDAAAELAYRDETSQTVVVLKGHRTVVTDGRRYALNPTGNPGMATGGSGDVLTGVITALVCQELPPLEAARLGVFVHGRAGDLAAAKTGQASLIATDLIDHLPPAFHSLAQKR
ncbi:MAG: ADP/ATP-dependent (S)-NAD(P)H-hydrate dehydratase [Planctomycetota bacterium]